MLQYRPCSPCCVILNTWEGKALHHPLRLMTRRMTRQELLEEKAARDAWFAKENAKLTPAEERALNQVDKMIDRNLIQWWN